MTGGSGFLGAYVVRELIRRGETVTVVGRRPVPGVAHLQADLTVAAPDFSGRRVTTVYHCAGLAHVEPRTEADRVAFRRVNVGGLVNLLAGLATAGRRPEAVVLASSVAVYGVQEGVLLDETTTRAPRGPYGASKREAEDVLARWAEERHLQCGIVRLPLVVGRRPPGNLGAMVRALRRGRYFSVGSGAARRSMVLASDVAAVLPEVARVGGVYHLTDGAHPTVGDLERTLCALLERPLPWRLPLTIARVAARVGDLAARLSGVAVPFDGARLTKMTSTLTFSDEAARRGLGWSPLPALDHVSEALQ